MKTINADHSVLHTESASAPKAEIKSTRLDGNSLKVTLSFDEDNSVSQMDGLIRVAGVNGLIDQQEVLPDENEYNFSIPNTYSNPLLFITLSIDNQEPQTVKIVR